MRLRELVEVIVCPKCCGAGKIYVRTRERNTVGYSSTELINCNECNGKRIIKKITAYSQIEDNDDSIEPILETRSDFTLPWDKIPRTVINNNIEKIPIDEENLYKEQIKHPREH